MISIKYFSNDLAARIDELRDVENVDLMTTVAGAPRSHFEQTAREEPGSAGRP